MRLLPLIGALALASAAAAAPAVPFGSHPRPYSASVIIPTVQTRAQMDAAVGSFYTTWKAAYVIGGCAAGRRRVNYDGANRTVSEAQGYGMLAAVLMAGYDAEAQTFFDDLYRYFRAHPATSTPAADLMAWKQDANCADTGGSDSASDGDLDIALALLMADRQWGSCGAINYRAEGIKVVNAIKAGDLDTSHRYVKLGNWVSTGDATYYPSTRSSDFMPGHYRSFGWATGDSSWTDALNTTYSIVASIQTNSSPTTGFLPDFIKSPLTSPAPVVGFFLENVTTDGNVGYNACRDPWRLGTDLAVSGDARALAAMQKIKAFIKGAAGGSANALKAERYLDGTVIGNYEELSFSAPYMVNAMSDPGDVAWLNALWTSVRTSGGSGYFGDSIKLFSMIVASNNWWQPEALPDPCNPDAGTVDAGTPDAGVSDAGNVDAGATDAGTSDAGSTDAGTPDAGSTDAGASDAGADGGSPTDGMTGSCGCGTGAGPGASIPGFLLLAATCLALREMHRRRALRAR